MKGIWLSFILQSQPQRGQRQRPRQEQRNDTRSKPHRNGQVGGRPEDRQNGGPPMANGIQKADTNDRYPNSETRISGRNTASNGPLNSAMTHISSSLHLPAPELWKQQRTTSSLFDVFQDHNWKPLLPVLVPTSGNLAEQFISLCYLGAWTMNTFHHVLLSPNSVFIAAINFLLIHHITPFSRMHAARTKTLLLQYSLLAFLTTLQNTVPFPSPTQDHPFSKTYNCNADTISFPAYPA